MVYDLDSKEVDFFDKTFEYSKGDLVDYNGVIYKCLFNEVVGSFDSSSWCSPFASYICVFSGILSTGVTSGNVVNTSSYKTWFTVESSVSTGTCALTFPDLISTDYYYNLTSSTNNSYAYNVYDSGLTSSKIIAYNIGTGSKINSVLLNVSMYVSIDSLPLLKP